MNRTDIVRRYRACTVPLLLIGPWGVGKTHLASQIAPDLVRVNCAQFSRELLAVELFGAVHGAYTGATDRPGLVERAGTLFLDEAGELSSELQAQLLMLLDEGRFRRVGSVEVRPTNVRVILATWREPETWMRPDLLDRFGYDVVKVPPLDDAELREAIEEWVAAFTQGRTLRLRVRPEVVERLVADAARGARAVRKRLEYACTTAEQCGSTRVEIEHLPVAEALPHPFEVVLREAFDAAGGSAARVAERFDVGRSTAYRWRKSLGIRRQGR